MPKLFAPVMLLAAIAACGCANVSPAAKLGLRNALTASQREDPTIDAAPRSESAKPVEAIPTPVGPPPELSDSAAMARIAPALAKIAAADQELHAEVLQQLTGTQPHLWSLTVQRAEHLLEYQQQVASRQTPPATTLAVPPVSPPATAPIVQASATAPIAPLPPPLPTVLAPPAPARPAGVTANPYYPVAAAPTPTAYSPAPAPAAEEPEPLAWREHLVQAIDRFQETEKKKPRSRDEAQEHVRLRLLQLAAGQDDEAAAAPPGLPPGEQSYWSNQLWAMSTLLQSKGDDFQAKVEAAGRHQEQATTKLSEMGALKVRSLAACETILGYGAYEPIREATYRPGEVLFLYAEIENYRSDTTDEGYHTLIGCSYRLINANGDEAIMLEMPAINDLCLSRRQDFHLNVEIPLPTGLREGEYRLELTVTDRLAKKTDRSELPIRILRR